MAWHIRLNCNNAVKKLQQMGKLVVFDKTKVHVYIPNGSHLDVYGRTMPVSRLVSILVNGTETIPPRPFTTDAGRDLNSQLLQLFHQAIKYRHINSTSVLITFDADSLGQSAELMIKRWLFDGSYYKAVCPNAASTIRRKGSDVPLVETGRLVRSITYKVVTQ